MAHLMIDIETLGTAPDTVILTVAAQAFDPMGTGYYESSYYARVDFESQANRSIEDGTLSWWANQNSAAKDEAFAEDGRIALSDVLDELGKLIWQSSVIWANGPTFDMTILENAYKSHNKPLPWQYYKVRDARTVFNLKPELTVINSKIKVVEPGSPTHRQATHHALDDCRRQIDLLQETLKQLNVKEVS